MIFIHFIPISIVLIIVPASICALICKEFELAIDRHLVSTNIPTTVPTNTPS